MGRKVRRMVGEEDGKEVEWDDRFIAWFVDNQWMFLVAKFPEFKCTPEDSGTFSNVYKLQLCDNSRSRQGHDSSQAEPQIVEVKKFNDNLVDNFHKESENLRTIEAMEPHRHLIKPIAMFQRGTHHCVMFPWASGGNLGQFWIRNDEIQQNPKQRAPLVSWCLEQMVSISGALHVLHSKNCRHGDLKPENLLHFEEEDGRWGRLVVADFGLSKFHIQETNIRTKGSSNLSRTIRYEPPEVRQLVEDKPRSRHYDIWSYLNNLKPNILKRDGTMDKFWHDDKDGHPEVHPLARQEMNKILNHSKANSATQDIVRLVRDRLLVVKYLDAHSTEDQAEGEVTRASAEELWNSMIDIQARASGNISYLRGQRIAPRTGMGNSLSVREKGHRRKDSGINLPQEEEGDHTEGPTILLRRATGDIGQDSEAHKPSTHPQTYRVEQVVDLNDRWASSTDNDFARALFRRADWIPPAPPEAASTAKCAECSTIDLVSPRSEIPFDPDQLRLKSGDCGICAVILEALSCLGRDKQPGSIVRVGSEFRIASTGDGVNKDPFVLSMYADPRAAQPDVEAVSHLGYPDLPGTDSPQQYEIMRAWRDTCDENHQGCDPWRDGDELPRMPTRAIDVGTSPGDDVPRLVETSAGPLDAKYIALSHCWGQLRDYEKFCTTKDTIESIKAHIAFDRLPKSFRDTVTVTRQLGVRATRADWEAEAQKMGDVFRFAYCTLAASSAESSIKGFTGDPTGKKPRMSRKDHVEESILESRGWVFQERALSRRTLHFTSAQMYWECGQGVHCETLGKLQNKKAALMGDPQFPESALQYFNAGRIVMFQHVYQTYSKLAFTHWSDRAVALLGLESRLGAAYRTRAEFGVLEEYLQRSLLWKRANTCARLARIAQPPGVRVPSWSWMAYRGEIGYFDIAWDRTDWCGDNVGNPFAGQKSLRHSRDGKAMRFRAVACGFAVADKVDWNKAVVRVAPDKGLIPGCRAPRSPLGI
ncbi:hypothetical protein PG994_001051 [Apiospora phragmitis]|uniref:Protein kinase domain-containing protein n=1 Tax=Apiospora phragmitis TaxID=2905665 RepID=A0ABR1WSF5_9PEZI